jgi:hypothetical protein
MVYTCQSLGPLICTPLRLLIGPRCGPRAIHNSYHCNFGMSISSLNRSVFTQDVNIKVLSKKFCLHLNILTADFVLKINISYILYHRWVLTPSMGTRWRNRLGHWALMPKVLGSIPTEDEPYTETHIHISHE